MLGTVDVINSVYDELSTLAPSVTTEHLASGRPAASRPCRPGPAVRRHVSAVPAPVETAETCFAAADAARGSSARCPAPAR